MNNPFYRLHLESSSEEKLNLIQEALDKERLIRFATNIKVYNLVELIWAFFYKRLPTYFADSVNTLQTSSGRNRSLIDFYLLQKYYLKHPLSFIQCHKIYFNLPREFRFILMDNKLNPVTKANYKNAKNFYYCGTVSRNVFCANAAVLLNNINYLTSILKNLKDKGFIDSIIPNKAIKPEFKADSKDQGSELKVFPKIRCIKSKIAKIKVGEIYNITSGKIGSTYIILDFTISLANPFDSEKFQDVLFEEVKDDEKV